MKLFAAVLGAAVASAQYTKVTFTHFASTDCSGDGNTTEEPVGTCIKERRDGHFRQVSCAADGNSFVDQEYSDDTCQTTRGDPHTVDCTVCHRWGGAHGSMKTACATNTLSDEVFAQFTKFMDEHGKVYPTRAETMKRAQIFAQNLEKAARLSENDTAEFGVTKFSDLTAEEFRDTYLMPNYESVTADEDRVVPEGPVANDIDWRTQGAVTPVKDQGQCGSCWAFSATEAIESYAKLSGKYSLQQLSPQQINSCDKRDGGCRGGNTETAYNYVHTAGGIETEASYPYTSGHGQTGTCKADPSKFAVSIAGYRSVARGESNLATALNSGPASICVAADAFQSYRGGILSSCPGRIDHCVQAVGYTADYWIVRNSWGTRWGEQGFIRVKRGSNLCHISDDVTYPTF